MRRIKFRILELLFKIQGLWMYSKLRSYDRQRQQIYKANINFEQYMKEPKFGFCKLVKGNFISLSYHTSRRSARTICGTIMASMGVISGDSPVGVGKTFWKRPLDRSWYTEVVFFLLPLFAFKLAFFRWLVIAERIADEFTCPDVSFKTWEQ